MGGAARVGLLGCRSRPDCVFPSLQSNKVPVVQHPHHVHPLTPLITYSNEHFTPGNPPPHLPADVDPKTGRTRAWVQRRCAVPGPPEDLLRCGGWFGDLGWGQQWRGPSSSPTCWPGTSFGKPEPGEGVDLTSPLEKSIFSAQFSPELQVPLCSGCMWHHPSHLGHYFFFPLKVITNLGTVSHWFYLDANFLSFVLRSGFPSLQLTLETLNLWLLR